ncbi:MAG: 4,5-DOPA dioxygenase extradiol [Pseudomonadota bacterium]
MPRMPVVYFGHGSPTNVLEDNIFTRDWRQVGQEVPSPTAILCISAHWFTHGTGVTAMQQPRTIHDFGPLSPDLFKQHYGAPGDPALAQRVADLLAPVPVELDHNWGFDHGCWTVLSKAYPAADIPIVQLSIDASKAPRWHYELAQKLRPLRDEGVLIVASGNLVHNLRTLEWSDTVQSYDWGLAFRDFMISHIRARDIDPILSYETEGPSAAQAAPDRDHFYPIFYALGASDERDAIELRTDRFQFKSIHMGSFVFGDKAAA